MTHLVIVKRPSKYKHGIKADFTAVPWWTVHFYNAKGELVRNEILVRHIRGIWSSGQIKVVDGIDSDKQRYHPNANQTLPRFLK